MTLSPRLCTLRHAGSYTSKYWRTLPPGAPDNLIPFTQLYLRMKARADESTKVAMASTAATDNSNAAAAAAAAPPPAALYRHFHLLLLLLPHPLRCTATSIPASCGVA